MATYEVIVQTRQGEVSVHVEADNRRDAYAQAAYAAGGTAVDSRRLYDPAEQQQRRETGQRISRLVDLEGKQNSYELQQTFDKIDASRGRSPSPAFASFRSSAPTHSDLAEIARLRAELGWD